MDSDLIKTFIRQYWLQILALAVFLSALIRYVALAEWERRLVPFAIAFFGLVCVVAPSEVAGWMGRYGWTRQQWRELPSVFLQFTGSVGLVVATLVLYFK